MSHTADAVTAPDTEVIQVGDDIGQRAERRGLVQGAVRGMLKKSSYSRRTVIRWRWFQINVRSSSSRRQLPIQRSMIELPRIVNYTRSA